MAKYRSNRRRGQRRGLTAAQQAAHDKAWAEADHSIEGRFSKGDVVADYSGNCWKITTYGIAYHEDVSNRIYGVQPTARGPKGWKETCLLRETIQQVLREGTHEPGSRGGWSRAEDGSYIDHQQARPEGEQIAAWQDGRAGSLASYPTLTVYEGGVIRVVSPNMDDSPSVAWLKNPKLAKKIVKAISKCLSPVHLPEVHVKERTTTLKIEPDHPRYASYAAARGAVKKGPEYAKYGEEGYAEQEGEWAREHAIEMPKSEHRRIKAELDARLEACLVEIDPSHRQFAEAILREQSDTDRDTARLVYADWLDEQGDPRGEAIRISMQNRSEGGAQ